MKHDLMDLLLMFNKLNREKQLFISGDRLLVAVSGGMDSMCLCHLLLKSNQPFSVAHMNFQLRGSESDGDEEFVRSWCQENQIPFFFKRVNAENYSQSSGKGIQEAARELRYQWFDELRIAHSFNKILTAHHSDDAVETALHHFFRGTGINGLTGITERKEHLIRPLLFASRDQISKYVAEHSIAFREDSSNKSVKYTRNFIRNEIIPLLESRYPSLKSTILENASRLGKLNHEISSFVDGMLEKLSHREGAVIKYPVLALLRSSFNDQLLMKLLENSGGQASQLNELIKLLNADSGKFLLTKTHRLLRHRKWLVATELNDQYEGPFIIESNETKIKFGGGCFEVRPVSRFHSEKDQTVEMIDASLVEYPLILRKWKTGDYFYPLGMKHKKKLSRFFIDEKLSVAEKEKTWILESANRIIWVVGLRIDNRFRVKPTSSNIIRLQWKPSDQD